VSDLIGFRSGERVLVVDVTASEALPSVEAFFPEYGAPAHGRSPNLTLSREGGEYRIATERGIWRAPTLPDILTRLELILAETLVSDRGLIGVHAAGVDLGGGAVLFTGAGGSGKSSLTAGFAVHGCSIFGDDVVFMNQGTIHAFSRLIKVEEPARTLLGLPEPRGILAGLWTDASLYEPSELGSAWADPADLRAVVLPVRSGGEPVLRPVAPARALTELLSGIVMQTTLSVEAFHAVADALERIPCYALTFGETREAVELLSSELG
jgi:hypothetical protein